jgi:hypothetical protein
MKSKMAIALTLYVVAVSAMAQKVYRWTNPKTGQVLVTTTLPPYPIKESRIVGRLPNGDMVELILDSNAPEVKALVEKRNAREKEQKRIAQEKVREHAAREAEQERIAQEKAREHAADWELVRTQRRMKLVVVSKTRQGDIALYKEAIQGVCGNGQMCIVHFWTDRKRVPATIPMSTAELKAKTASYTRNPNTGFEQFLWNCRIKNDPNQCFDD